MFPVYKAALICFDLYFLLFGSLFSKTLTADAPCLRIALFSDFLIDRFLLY